MAFQAHGRRSAFDTFCSVAQEPRRTYGRGVLATPEGAVSGDMDVELNLYYTVCSASAI